MRGSALVGVLPLLAGLVVAGVGIGAQLPSHAITGGVVVNCESKTVTVTVTSWSGHVEIVKLPSGPTTEGASNIVGSGVATFSISSIGGNGSYTAGREEDTVGNDPTPVAFKVDCEESHPTPTPTPSPVASPSPSPEASPSPSPVASPSPSPVASPSPHPSPRPTPTPVVHPTPTPGLPNTGAYWG